MPKQKYDPSEFVIPAKDNRGESSRLWARVQPGHDRALDVIVNERKFPFKTKGDAIRWCIHQGIKRLEMMEHTTADTHRVDAIIALVRAQEQYAEFATVIETTQTFVNTAMKGGDTSEARRVVAEILGQVEKFDDGHWRDKYLKAMKERFGHLLEANGKGAKLRVVGGGD